MPNRWWAANRGEAIAVSSMLSDGDSRVEYWLIGEGAQAPERHKGAALDLRARLPEKGKRWVWGFARIPTGVALHIPENAVVRITGRSGNFLRGFIVHDGLVESEFNGNEVCVLVFCPLPRVIHHGQRVAQMWSLPIDREAFQRRQVAPEGVGTEKDGFGSTGM
ncbi:MAG: hypothetical protein U9R48_07035 [Chloroflexota bacterium]|nr:hypothetical protein [Chloroflexota bacterium]